MRTIAIIILFMLSFQKILTQDTLTSDIVFLTYHKIKNKGINKKDLVPFLERYYNEEFAQKSADKTTKEQYINQKLEYYKSQLATFDFKRPFITTTSINIKEYDKAKQSFNLELEHYFMRGIINPDKKWGGKLDFVGKASNIDKYKDLNMDCDKLIDIFVNANPFINKDSILVTINLRFYEAIFDEVNVFGSTKLFTGYVMCNINKITFHFSDAEKYVYSQ